MKVLTDNKYYGQIADVIREQNGTNNTYKPAQMVSALKDLFYEEVEGVPPITFQGIGENLLDYKIDGAVGGVGDRTKNLFDYSTVTTGYRITWSTGISVADNSAIMSDFIAVSNGIYRANVSVNLIGYDINKNYIGTYDPNNKIFRKDYSSKTTYYDIADNNVKFVKLLSYSATDTISQNTMFCNSTTILEYEPYGYKAPVVINGKNLLKNTASSQTINGVTFTVNNDGSIICNGTSSAVTTFAISIKLNSNINYVLSGSPKNGGYEAYRLDLRNSSYSVYNNIVDNGDGINFTVEENGTYLVCIRIAANYTCNNLTFYPMIRLASIQDDTYEPYIEPTTTNIYLDEPIEGKANIPSEYTEVEYIESTGTQYINTNIIPTNTTGVEAKITICNDNNWDNVFIGCRETASGENRYWIDVDWTGTDTIIFGFNGNTSTNDRYSLKKSDVGKSFIISMNYMNDRTGKVNGITYDTSISSKTLVSISKPMYIFAGNRSGNAAYQYSGKLYNLKITDGTNVIKNFVPCYRNSDNVAGLYDLVNNVFYTNQGTGNFIVGPIKENESISLSETNVDIPTIRGTNVLTVDTTVQPSNVYVKSRHESSYEAAMRERYEEAQAQLDALESGGE